MAQNTRESFDYESYVRNVLGGTDDDFTSEGFNQQQKDFIYGDAVKEVHKLNLKDTVGKDKTNRAIRKTLNQFADSRAILGVPEEVQDFNEPYRADRFSEFLNTIHESNRDLPVDNFLGKYTSEFYDSDFAEFERPFLQDLDRSVFKQRLKDRLGDRVDFEFDSVSEAIRKLETSQDDTNQSQIRPDEDGTLSENEGGFLNSVGEFIGDAADVTGRFAKNVGVGFYNSIVNTGAGGLRLADSIINTPLIDEVIYDKETQEFKRVTEFGIEDVNEIQEQGTLSSLADILQANLSIEERPETFADEVALAGGNLLTFITGAGLAGKALGKVGATTTGTALGINQGAESGYQDYINTIKETDEPLDQKTARAATAFNALIGASEALPVLSTLTRLTPDGKIPIGTFLKKVDDVTNNSVSRAFNKVAGDNAGEVLSRAADSRLARAAIGGVSGAIEEGSQEIFAELASNLVASDILKYDPNRGFVTDEVVKGGEIGAILGAFTNALFAALTPRQRRELNNQFTEGEVQPETQPDDAVTGNAPPQEQSTIFRAQSFDPNAQQQSAVRQVSPGQKTEAGVKDLNQVDVNQRHDQLQAEFTTVPEGILADLNVEYEVETENIEDGVQRSVLNTENGRVVFTGDSVESELVELIEEYSPSDRATILRDGLTIDKTDGNYTLALGGIEIQNQDLRQGLSELNTVLDSEQINKNTIAITTESIPEPIVVPVENAGFNPNDVESQLSKQGFILLQNPDKRVKGRVSRNRFTAYKDGFIYDVKTRRSGPQSRIADITIRDIDGFRYSPNSNERGQEFLVNGVLQPPVEGPAFTRRINTTPTSGQTSGIILRQPSKGIKVIRADIATSDGSQPSFKIDAQSVDEVAQRIGGDVLFSDSDSAVIEKDGVSTSFVLTEDGQISAFTNGEGRLFNGPFSVDNTGRLNEMSLSLMTRELENLNYKVNDVTNNSVTLENNEGNVVTLSRDGEQFEADSGEIQQEIADLSDFRRVFNLPQPVNLIEDVTEEPTQQVEEQDDFESAPVDNMQMIRDKQQTLDNMFDFSRERAAIQNVDDKPTFISEDGIRVQLDINPDQVETTLEQIRINASIPTDYEENTETVVNWTDEQLNNYLNIIPEHIRDIINIHRNVINPASKIGAWGYFTPYDENNRPAIHVDARPGRNFYNVLSTISEEIGHFSFNSWAIPELDAMYDQAYDLVKDDAIRGLDAYIERYSIDVNNPSPTHKWLIVNEFFSKQGMSLIDFNETKIDLPPGVTRERMKQLKDSVLGNITKVQIDLTKNFRGNKEDGKQFIEDILRLQSAASFGRGVKLTYNFEKPDGTPTTIEVNTTPYGSQEMTRSEIRDSKSVSKVRKMMANASGFRRRMKLFYIEQLRSIVETPIGRNGSVILNGVYQPVSTQEITRLKGIQVQAHKVRAWLDSVGVGEIPIGTSYLETFERSGLTKKRQLSLAKEMDEFIKYAFTQANNNVGVIRQELRRSQDLLGQLVVNHPAARVNLPKWNREIEQKIRRFSSDWDHIAYHAYQPGGDKALITMKDALFPRKKAKDLTLNERVSKAKTEIKKINSQLENGKLSFNKAAVKRRAQEEIIDIKNRLDALQRWAQIEVGDRGDRAVRGLMIDKLDQIINRNHNYNVPGGNTTDEFISATKGRKLDENVAQDRDYMIFLGRITDPLQVSIFNIEQQTKVLNNIRHTTRLAEYFVKTHIARPIGSTENQSEYLKGDTHVFDGENAGLLNYLEFDPVMAPFVKDEQELNKAVERNSMASWARLVRTVKAGQTVFNPKVLSSNYWSNIESLFYTGHLAYINKYATAASGIKYGWAEQAAFGSDILNETAGQMIAREMAESGVLQSSIGSLDVKLTNGSYAQQVLNAATSVIESGGVISKNTKIHIDDVVGKFMDVMRRGYAFGDEAPKFITYIVNRQIGIAKAQTTIKRDNFQLGKKGDVEYTQSVVNMAIDIAADRTNRETTTWVVAPKFAKQMARNGFTLLFNDYIMHPFQMAKISIENSRMLAEDAKEYKDAKRVARESGDESQVEYANALRNRIATRAMGIATTEAGAYMLWTVGIGVWGYGLTSLADIFTEDEEDDVELKDRKTLTRVEKDAALRINNAVQHGWGGDPLYPMSRNGYEITYVDGKRLSAINALFPSEPPTNNETSFTDLATETLNTFMNFNDETITLKLINLVTTDKNPRGGKYSITDRANEFTKLITPGIFKQGAALATSINDVVVDPPIEDGGPRPMQLLRDSAFAIMGVKIKTTDVRDEMINIGWAVVNQTNPNRNSTLGDFRDRLRSGERLSQSEVQGLVKNMVDNNNEVMGYVDYAIDAYRDFGLSYSEIERHLRFRRDGVTGPGKQLSKKLTSKLIKGVNGFHDSTITQLNNLRDKTQSAKVSSTLSSEEKENKLNALDLAINLYQGYLNSVR